MRTTEGLHDVEHEKMEGLAVDPDKGQDRSQRKQDYADHYEKDEGECSVGDGDQKNIDQHDHELPDRDRAENLVFNVDELRDDVLLWHGLSIAFIRTSTSGSGSSVL